MKLVNKSNLLNISGGVQINISGGVQMPCYSSWSMTLTYSVLKGGLIGFLMGMPLDNCFNGMVIGGCFGAGVAFGNADAADANICVEHMAQ